MKLITSTKREYEVDFAGGPSLMSGQVLVQMQDSRKLSEIVPEFDGLAWFERQSETEGNKRFEGYSRVMRAVQEGTRVTLSFAKEA